MSEARAGHPQLPLLPHPLLTPPQHAPTTTNPGIEDGKPDTPYVLVEGVSFIRLRKAGIEPEQVCWCVLVCVQLRLRPC
jgi:hypothetical protein